MGADPYVVRGYYKNETGIIRKISQYENFIIVGNTKVQFANIEDISGSLFDEITALFAE